jgi:hypothetical protein
MAYLRVASARRLCWAQHMGEAGGTRVECALLVWRCLRAALPRSVLPALCELAFVLCQPAFVLLHFRSSEAADAVLAASEQSMVRLTRFRMPAASEQSRRLLPPLSLDVELLDCVEL